MADLPTKTELSDMLKRADAAGDAEAATTFANMLSRHQYVDDPVELVDVPASVARDERAGQQTAGDKLVEGGKFALGSVMRGAADLPAGMMGSLIPPSISLSKAPDFSTRNQVTEAVTEFGPSLIGAEKPTSAGGRMVDSGIRALTAASPMGKGEALVSLISALGGQGAIELLEAGGAPNWAKLLGGLGGSMVAGSAAGASRNILPKPLEEVLRGKVDDPAALRQAAASAKQARREGFQANTLDMMSEQSPLHDVQNSLAMVGGADKTVANVRRQGGQLQDLGNKLVADTPGRILPPQIIANEARGAATTLLQDMNKQAREAFDTELATVQNARATQNSTDLNTAQTDLADARQVRADVETGVAPMLAEEKEAARQWMVERQKTMTQEETANLAKAGREVSNEMAFGVDELGNWGTLLAARETLTGRNKRTWTAQELRERGVDDETLGALMQQRQPTMGFETQQADPKKVLGLQRDNPGGDWLERKKRAPAEAIARDPSDKMAQKGLTGATTASATTTIPAQMLKGLRGVLDENPRPGTPKYDRLKQSVQSDGWKKDSTIMVFVNDRGEAFLYEGNNRARVALEEGVPDVKVEIQWRNGAEDTPGEWNPQTLANRLTQTTPKTSSTGAMDVEGAVQTTPTPTREGNVARAITKSAQADVDAAEQALLNVQSRIAGQEVLTPEAKAGVISKIRQQIADKRGDPGLEADLNWVVENVQGLNTAKELHNFILAIKKDLPSVKALGNSAADMSENSVLGKSVATLKGLRNDVAPEYRAADDAFKAHKDARRDVLENSYVGKMAGPRGSILEQDAQAGLVYRMLKEGESPRSEVSALRNTLSELRKTEPKLIPTILRSYLDEVMSETFGSGNRAFRPEHPGEKLTGRLGDVSQPTNDKRLHALRILVDEAGKAEGRSASARLAMQRGVERFVELANANTRTPRSVRAFTPQELDNILRSEAGLAALRLVGVNWGSVLVNSLRNPRRLKTLNKLDELFSNPDKVEDLIKLGQSKGLTRDQRSAIAALIGYSQTQEPPTGDIPR